MSATTSGNNPDWISGVSVQCMQIARRNIIHISASIIKPISGIGSNSVAIASGLTNVIADWEVITITNRGHIVRLFGGTNGMVLISYIRSLQQHDNGSDFIVGVVACAL